MRRIANVRFCLQLLKIKKKKKVVSNSFVFFEDHLVLSGV